MKVRRLLTSKPTGTRDRAVKSLTQSRAVWVNTIDTATWTMSNPVRMRRNDLTTGLPFRNVSDGDTFQDATPTNRPQSTAVQAAIAVAVSSIERVIPIRQSGDRNDRATAVPHAATMRLPAPPSEAISACSIT